MSSFKLHYFLEAVAWGCSIKKVFLEIASAHNFIRKETLAQVFSSEFCEIFKNTFSYRTPTMVFSDFYNSNHGI